ncbi:YqjF family protein [Georgenia deserti]|uniref:YqjF family protein n=1 Tax=Georgenia deserti TaxID=2093781 RepID=A0ABW4L8S2_9MICO
MVGREADRPARAAVSHQHWEHVVFLHWPIPARDLVPLLPPGLCPHTADGTAWLTVTPLRMHARPAFLPRLPYVSHFDEVNVRTYVIGPDGRDGVWFFSLECPRSPVVVALRAVGLRYVWSRTAVRVRAEYLAVTSERRDGRGRMQASIRVREREDLDPLATFLTGRWSAYVRRFGHLLRIDIEHPPWPLYRADARADVADLLRADGLPSVQDRPLAHYSPGVRARIGWPRPVGGPGEGGSSEWPATARHNGPHA